MIISMVAAMAANRVIGKGNKMPWHLPADLRHFKQVTMGKPVIMGRKTFESIGRTLPGRRNIIVSRSLSRDDNNAEWVSSLQQAFSLLQQHAEVMVIGGGEIYRQCLPLAQRLYLTEIELETEGDAYFPDYRQAARWHLSAERLQPADEHNRYNCRFITLERVE